MAKQEFKRLLLAAALVGGIAAARCGADKQKRPDWEIPTPAAVVAAEGDDLPPAELAPEWQDGAERGSLHEQLEKKRRIQQALAARVLIKTEAGICNGVSIGGGRVVTNIHCITGGGVIEISTGDGRWAPVVPERASFLVDGDVLYITTDKTDLTAGVPFADTQQVQVGDELNMVGFEVNVLPNGEVETGDTVAPVEVVALYNRGVVAVGGSEQAMDAGSSGSGLYVGLDGVNEKFGLVGGLTGSLLRRSDGKNFVSAAKFYGINPAAIESIGEFSFLH